MDYVKANQSFWDKWSKEGGPWSKRSSKELIEKARNGDVQIFITTQKIVPKEWLPIDWNNKKVLGLASGGGQQMPIIAATGAQVTSFDISHEQLERDLEVCNNEKLEVQIQQGDM